MDEFIFAFRVVHLPRILFGLREFELESNCRAFLRELMGVEIGWQIVI